MGRVRCAGTLLAVAMLALSLGGGVAGAKKHKKKPGWPSKVSVTHPSSTVFKGVVKSNLKACRGSRVVTVFYTDPNNGQVSPLSVQRTDNKGRYQVTLTTPAYGGGYQAQVAKRKIRALNARQTCKAAKSGTLTAETPPS